MPTKPKRKVIVSDSEDSYVFENQKNSKINKSSSSNTMDVANNSKYKIIIIYIILYYIIIFNFINFK